MNNNLVTTTTSNALIEFDNSQMELIKRTIAEGATPDELDLFMYQCKRTGLDPLARQIHFQKFKGKNGKPDKVSFITTIDGYRLIATRTGTYAGNNEAVFDGRIEIDDRANWEKIAHAPAKATVTVKRFVNGVICEFSSSAYWQEYYPGGARGQMWRKMPHVMLAKCAEAQALRKAFPNDLSGVYTAEEMNQAQPAQPQPAPVEDFLDVEFDESPGEIVEGDAGLLPTVEECRQWLSEQDSLTFAILASALYMTGKYDNNKDALQAIKNTDIVLTAGRTVRMSTPIKDKNVALNIFDEVVFMDKLEQAK